MSVSGLALPYCTVDYANAILGTSNGDWLGLNASQKEESLQWGRIYLDTTYSCLPWPVDEDGAYIEVVPDAVQTANAYAAGAYLEGLYFLVEDGSLRGRTRVEVRAGSVMSRVDYDAYLASFGWDDPTPLITAILGAIGCGPNKGFIQNIKLLRT